MAGPAARSFKFAEIGLDHRHMYKMAGRLLALGCECVGYWTDGEPQPLAGFIECYPIYRASPTSAVRWRILRCS